MAKRLFIEHPELKQLDKFSKKIAQLIYQQRREWLLHSRVSEYEGETFLEIRLHSPVRPTERDLLISTYRERITVHFDWYHAHFARHGEETMNEIFSQAMQFIQAVFNEEIIVGIRMVDGEWKGSTSFTPQMLSQELSLPVTYTRSWLGTFDKKTL